MDRATPSPLPLYLKGLTLAAAVLIGTPLAAQGGGQPPHEILRLDSGFAGGSCGDVDGDGVDDIILGDQGYDDLGNFLFNIGRVQVLSGADGSLIHEFLGSNDSDWFGSSAAGAGDVNADGVPDLIVGAVNTSPFGRQSAGSAFVYSGSDGALLYEHHGLTTFGNFGFSVAAAGDLNADGYDDYIIGDPLDSYHGGATAGVAWVHSGFNGNQLWGYVGTPGDLTGHCVGAAGDINGDGHDDVFVGSPGADNGVNNNQGNVTIYSGAAWAVLLQINGSATTQFGFTAAMGGDIDNDGIADIVIGEPYATPQSAGWQQVGAAYAYNINGTLLREWVGDLYNDQFGYSVAILADQNNDGADEVLIGAPFADVNGQYDNGSAFLFNGSDGAQLHRWDGLNPYMATGKVVGACGDLNGDGQDDFLINAEWDFTTSNYGSMTAWSWGVIPYLTSSANQISSAAGGTVQFDLDFPDSEASLNYMLVGSATGTGPTNVNGVDIPLTADWLSTWMTGNNPPGVFSNSQGQLDANGNATAYLNLPPGIAGAYVGTTYYFAAVSIAVPMVQLSSVAVPLTLDP